MENIENAIIDSVELSMEDHGCLTLLLSVSGYGWGCSVGGYVLGHGFVGAKNFTGCAKGIEEIMRVMDTVGVSKFSDLKGKYIRVVIENNSIKKFGHIIEDKWFDYNEFYSNGEEIMRATNAER